MAGEDETDNLEESAGELYEQYAVEEEMADSTAAEEAHDNGSNQFNEFDSNDDFADMFGNGAAEKENEDNFDSNDNRPNDGKENSSEDEEEPGGNQAGTANNGNKEISGKGKKGKQEKGQVEEEKAQSGDGKDDKKKKRKPKRDPYVGVINWHPGDPIDLEFLAKTWGSVSQIKEIKPFVDVANESVDQALKSTGPNLTLRLHRYVSRLVDNTVDTIGSLLKLLQSSGKKMLYLTISSVKAIFDQQWMERTLIAGLATALKEALRIPFISKILNAIFAVGVRIINHKFSKATA